MEGGGQLAWLPPEEIHGYGFQMILYPTTVLFRVTKAIETALAALKAEKPMTAGVSLDEFEEIVGLAGWKEIEEQFGG
jgi:hypothetical protein